MSRVSKRLVLPAVLALAGALSILPSSAAAMKVTVHTNRGGTCHIRTTASRTGTEIAYGVKVKDCSTHFGVRYAVSRGSLWDQTEDLPVADGYMDRKKGHLPYGNHRTVTGTQASHSYRTRIDLSIVLKTRRDLSTPHPERWNHSGKHCRVKTTDRDGDTLGCELGDTL
jgi:hypothetical protein